MTVTLTEQPGLLTPAFVATTASMAAHELIPRPRNNAGYMASCGEKAWV